MRALLSFLLAAALIQAPATARAQAPDAPGYVPPPGAWERRDPSGLGMSAEGLERAARLAAEAESPEPRDLSAAHLRGFGLREPLGDAVGPFKERGDPTGLVIRGGYIVAEWGEPERVDVTFSVTKSFLSSTAGLAWDRGLIPDLHEPVSRLMAPVQVERPECVAPRPDTRSFPQVPPPFEPFAGEHNARVTWDHLLRQTSDWEGMLWCKPDWADRPDQDPAAWGARVRHEPGSVYEYNDVRVNLLALALTNVWRKPLPSVLREHLMEPIGASPTWRWLGYETSWILLDGSWVQVVSGGAHWGGGMFISAMDMARLGLLHLRGGDWDGVQILSREWLELASTPGSANDRYGFMNFFLNTGRRDVPSAAESAVLHRGAGTNTIYVDPGNDLVVVLRWIRGNAVQEVLEAVLDAVEPGPPPAG